MAVTVISNPPVSPNVISVSYPTVIEMTSDKYGTANVTQFRYVAIVTSGIALGTKYTVPISAAASNGVFDVSELVKTVIDLSRWEFGSTTSEVTKITFAAPQASPSNIEFTVQIKEQYYLSGVFTTNTGSLLTFRAGRGWTNSSTKIWGKVNWWQYNGLSPFIPYSGVSKIVYPVRLYDPSWTSVATNPEFNIKRTYRTVTGALIAVTNDSFTRPGFGVTGYEDALVYIPLYKSGDTDRSTYGSVEVILSTRPYVAGPDTVEETFTIYKTINTCVDDELNVMFQDRFFQWSFMSFSKKQSTTVNTIPQQAETTDGRFRYNIKSSDTITLNTDWMADGVNEMFKDLMASEKCFLMTSDGSLEPITVVSDSLRLQTSRNEGLHQYQLQFRKSLDNFKA